MYLKVTLSLILAQNGPHLYDQFKILTQEPEPDEADEADEADEPDETDEADEADEAPRPDPIGRWRFRQVRFEAGPIGIKFEYPPGANPIIKEINENLHRVLDGWEGSELTRITSYEGIIKNIDEDDLKEYSEFRPVIFTFRRRVAEGGGRRRRRKTKRRKTRAKVSKKRRSRKTRTRR